MHDQFFRKLDNNVYSINSTVESKLTENNENEELNVNQSCKEEEN